MELRKLLIADGNEDFRSALAEALLGQYHVRTCGSGREALEILRSCNSDILVLNLMLPEIDGITLMERAVQEGIRPMVLVTTRYQNDYVLDTVSRLGVGYVMIRPCEIPAIVARIRDLSRRLEPPVFSPPDPQTQVTNLLLTLGIPTRLRGYQQAREAILKMAEDPDMAITKELYPAVAEICGGDWNHVERTIRSAIAAAWKRRDEQVWRQYFPPEPDGTVSKPTNGEFITRLAECLRMSRSPLPEDRT